MTIDRLKLINGFRIFHRCHIPEERTGVYRDLYYDSTAPHITLLSHGECAADCKAVRTRQTYYPDCIECMTNELEEMHAYLNYKI